MTASEPVAWMGQDYNGVKLEVYVSTERGKLPYRLYETAQPLYSEALVRELEADRDRLFKAHSVEMVRADKLEAENEALKEQIEIILEANSRSRP